VTLHLKSECSTGDATTTYKRTARNNGHFPEKTIKLRNNMPTTVAVVFELVREKNVDQAKFCMLVKKNCTKHLDKDVDK
jgi:hypothetical protein